jgi:hypothetical protein
VRVFEDEGMVGAQVCNVEVTRGDRKPMEEWARSEPLLTKLEARGSTFRNMTQ